MKTQKTSTANTHIHAAGMSMNGVVSMRVSGAVGVCMGDAVNVRMSDAVGVYMCICCPRQI